MNAQKARTGILTMLVVGLGALGLAGCGGETPHCHAGPPTATTMTTTTDPTATVSTETTTDPTATTSTETNVDPTATTGGSTSGGNEATDKLMKAGAAMDGLTTLPLTIDLEASGIASKLEVDVEKPDKYRIMTEASGMTTEIIVVGDKSYTKASGMDQYLEGPADRSFTGSR